MVLRNNELKSILKRLLLGLLLLEVFLGGSGRLLEITPFLTVRMIMFFLTLPVGVFLILLRKKISRNTCIALALITGIIIVSSIISFINEGVDHLFEDIKPLSSFLTIIFLSVFITNKPDIEFVKRLILYSSLILALFHVILYLFLILNVYDHQQLWVTLSYLSTQDTGPRGGEGEFFFKGAYGFIYYKGDLYMCIGLFFWQRATYSLLIRRTVITLITIGIFLTGTRGFILVVLIVYGMDWLSVRRSMTFYLAVLLGIGFVLTGYMLIMPYIGDKEESDLYRYIQIDQVIDQLTLWSLIWGHGFGIGVPVRPIHMEIAYLEMLHKQGIIGLLIWLYLLYFIYSLYSKVGKQVKPFWQASLFVYLISATNPYVNHPLGITIIIVSIACMDVLLKQSSKTSHTILNNVNVSF